MLFGNTELTLRQKSFFFIILQLIIKYLKHLLSHNLSNGKIFIVNENLYNFKKLEKHPWKSITFSKFALTMGPF